MKILKKINHSAFLILLALIVFIGFNVSLVNAQTLSENFGMVYAENLDLPASADDDVRDTAVVIVKYLITFLGIIAVIIILYGGFVWMTAAGSEDRVGKAKKIIIAGIIGLIIIIASFAIVNFVLNMTGQAMQGDLG